VTRLSDHIAPLHKKTGGASAKPQSLVTIIPHNFGFPSKLELGNVLSCPTHGIGPSRSLWETLNLERKWRLFTANGIAPVRWLFRLPSCFEISPDKLLKLKLSLVSNFNWPISWGIAPVKLFDSDPAFLGKYWLLSYILFLSANSIFSLTINQRTIFSVMIF